MKYEVFLLSGQMLALECEARFKDAYVIFEQNGEKYFIPNGNIAYIHEVT